MLNRVKIILGGLLLLVIAACGPKKIEVKNQDDFTAPPVAEKIAQKFINFGKERIDNYYWIREKEDKDALEYLQAENEYTQMVMAPTKELQEKIYGEIIGRIKEEDESYPSYQNGYYYYRRTEKGKQYPIHCRKRGSLEAEEEIIFDVNKMAEGKRAFRFARYSISPDNRLAAYSYNETGSFAEYTLKVVELESGKELDLSIEGVSSFTWANDNKTLFYTTISKTLRPYRVYRYTIGKDRLGRLVYEERDGRYNSGVYKSKTDEFIFILSRSSTTTEVRMLSADNPEGQFTIFRERQQGVESSLNHHENGFVVRYKDEENLNGALYLAPLVGYQNMENWKSILKHDEKSMIEGYDIYKDYLAIQLRENGLIEIEIYNLNSGDSRRISFPEPVYTASLSGNPEYDATTFRYSYTSLNRPATLYEHNIEDGSTKMLKQTEIPSGFNPDDYVVERLWADAKDGVKVPMAIVYKKGIKLNGSSPTLLYSYGSYGVSSDVRFPLASYSLIDRGFVYAIAQIRGGSDLGEQWYEDGKLLNKKNTFTDFIACAEKLIDDKYTSPAKLAIMGGSAGGLLVGAVANMRPELFNTVVAQVPFVDVISTMLDTSLPLTTQEYEEWGDPNVEEYYDYILSYSPYDNIEKKNYPNILATGGLNDSQVLFHEPTKWVAKLRDYKTDNNILLLYMNMDSGHGGATGRYDHLKEVAFEYAFILDRVGIRE